MVFEKNFHKYSWAIFLALITSFSALTRLMLHDFLFSLFFCFYLHIYANIRIRLFLNILVGSKGRAVVVGEPHKEFSIISDFETSSSFG